MQVTAGTSRRFLNMKSQMPGGSTVRLYAQIDRSARQMN